MEFGEVVICIVRGASVLATLLGVMAWWGAMEEKESKITSVGIGMVVAIAFFIILVCFGTVLTGIIFAAKSIGS